MKIGPIKEELNEVFRSISHTCWDPNLKVFMNETQTLFLDVTIYYEYIVNCIFKY